jgi:hypothetical protein
MVVDTVEKFNLIKNKISEVVPFVALITTSWHLDNLISFVMLNNLCGGVVIVQPQSNINNNTKFRLSAEQFAQYTDLFSHVYFLKDPYLKIDFIAIIKYFFYIFQNTAYLICPNTRLSIRLLSSLLHLKLSFQYVIIDEGLGCYLSYEDAWHYGKNNKIKRKINNLLYRLSIKPLINRFCKPEKISDFRLFTSYQNQLVCNEAVANSIRKVYDNRIYKVISKVHIDNIIIFKDFNVVDKKVDFIVYSRLLEYFQNLNYFVYIKKHPNDIDIDYDNLVKQYPNVQIINTIYSGEELISICHPQIVIGGYTTALFSSANIFKTKSISFMTIYLSLDGIGKSLCRNIKFFSKNFSNNNYLVFPSTFENLFQNIESLIHNKTN